MTLTSDNSLIQIALIARHASLWSGRHVAIGIILARNIGPLNEIAQSGDVMVRTGHEHGSRRRTCCGGVEIGEANALFCKLGMSASEDGQTKDRLGATRRRWRRALQLNRKIP